MTQPTNGQGYHLVEIEKGQIGTASKVLEEAHELLDAEEQGCRIMMLVEMSDLVGALLLLLEKEFPDMTLGDLTDMARITRRAFESGSRK